MALMISARVVASTDKHQASQTTANRRDKAERHCDLAPFAVDHPPGAKLGTPNTASLFDWPVYFFSKNRARDIYQGWRFLRKIPLDHSWFMEVFLCGIQSGELGQQVLCTGLV
jgi:hypothetical protein